MSEKNKYGQYFTIDEIASFMVNLIGKDKGAKVLEPSCGEGVFLKYLQRYGFCSLSAYEIDKSLISEYDFIKYESFVSSPLDEKFDVVIGNPPYIRWKNLEQELKNELTTNPLWNKYFNNLCDYLFLFILKSIEQLNDNGELIFICTEYWMSTTHSDTLRNYMCQHGYICEIYHFKEAPLFDKVTASFVIFKYIKSNSLKKTIDFYTYNKIGKPKEDELLSKKCFNRQIIPQFRQYERWLLATEETQSRLKSFEEVCTRPSKSFFDKELYRIGDICDIGNGMVSGADKAFLVSNIDDLNEKERRHLIRVYKAKDIEAYSAKKESYYLFMQDKKIHKELLRIEYPHFYTQLERHIDKLYSRYNYHRDIPFWEFVFLRNQKLFERKQDKIFVPCKERISKKKHFRFCFAPEGVYPLQDVTALVPKECCKESLYYLLAYLNSNIIFDWLNLNGIVKGAIIEFSEAPIASIPYRPIRWENKEEVDLHHKITEEVKAYLQDLDANHLKNVRFNINKLLLR